MSQSDARLRRWKTQEGIMKKAVKRAKSKSSAKRATVKLKTKQMTKAKAVRKTKKTTKAKVARETRKVVVPKAPIELKTVVKKAATAAIVAAGLAALDTALDALKLNNDSPAATDPNKSDAN
jgi:dsDNA-specific endonuclease/ATPase MutS2